MATWLTTREAVKAALDIQETARSNDAVDRAIRAASELVEAVLHRSFRPTVATYHFPWPKPGTGTTWKLYLDNHDLISITSLTSAGDTIPSSGYYLEPNTGPPYSHLEINRGSSYSFDYGDTNQRSITIVGVWGHSNNETNIGTIVEGLDASETGVNVSNGYAVGVGDVIRVDEERMQVTGRTWLDTGDTIQADLASNKGGRTVAVTDGTTFTVGEALLIGSETFWITDIAGNNLTCRRAWDGSTLAAHTTGATIYASRTLTVQRGALGTTATTHTTGTTLYRHDVPEAVSELVLAEAQIVLGLRQARQAVEAGQGQTSHDVSGGGIAKMRQDVRRSHGRHHRFRSV
jgi:uncharacterized Zn finger protein